VKEWDGSIAATFIVDREGVLWIADRRSEHVACARFESVRTAGELFFEIGPKALQIVRVTNQSTGYCPEPESWAAVAEAFEAAGLAHPDGFDPAFEFRRCPACRQIALIKDEDYTCAMCSEPLPGRWNLDG
jgi:hypothetical protein